MSTQYTQGQLIFKDGVSNRVHLLDSKVEGAVGEVLHVDLRRASDARRLVACWNACQGITTESLEDNGVADMSMALALCNKIDRLAVALKDIVKSLSDQDDEGMIEHTEQMIAARAALALVNAQL